MIPSCEPVAHHVEASSRLAEYLRPPTMPFFLWMRFLAGEATVLSKFCGEMYSVFFERSTIMSRMRQLWSDSGFLESIKKGTQAKAAGADTAGTDSAGFAGGASSSAQADAAPGKTMEDYMQSPPMLAARRGGLKKVFVEPSELFLEAGGAHYGFTAVALYGDGSRLNIPNDSVTWDSSKNNVAPIHKTGGVVTEFP